ncbi:MAG: hypothetical protein V2A65_11590 [Candidatus Omnitrophota bacterium]
MRKLIILVSIILVGFTVVRVGYLLPAPTLIAMSGEGKIGSAAPKSLKMAGRVIGDFGAGTYEISGLKVKIEQFGEVTVSGRIETKGQLSRLSINMSDLSLTELKKSLGTLPLPEQGRLDGKVILTLGREKKEWKVQRLDYDILFGDLLFEKQKIPQFTGTAQGYYDLLAETGRVNKAHFVTKTGGEIDLSGTVGKKGFDISFTSEGLYLEDLLDSLPPAIKEKMGLKVEKVAGNATYDSEKGSFVSRASFSFYQAEGKGEVLGHRSEKGEQNISGRLSLEGLNLLPLSSLYGEGAQISGVANLGLDFQTRMENLKFLQAIIETVPAKGIRQYLDFRAVKALLALSTGSPPGYLVDKAYYGYRKLAARVTYQDRFLTIEGLAKKNRNKEYVLLGTPFGQTVNIAIDPRGNTVNLDDLKQRLGQAFK